jgi:hypothetical protein
MNIQPFEVHIPDIILYDLQERLADIRWPDEIPDSGWNYGTNLGYLKELVDYWQHKFEWRKQEVKLNKFNQFIPEGYDLVEGEFVRKGDLLSAMDIEKHIQKNIVPFFKKYGFNIKRIPRATRRKAAQQHIIQTKVR